MNGDTRNGKCLPASICGTVVVSRSSGSAIVKAVALKLGGRERRRAGEGAGGVSTECDHVALVAVVVPILL